MVISKQIFNSTLMNIKQYKLKEYGSKRQILLNFMREKVGNPAQIYL